MPRATAPPPPHPAAGPASFSPVALGANLTRHALPLVALYLLHGTVAGFLLLTAFNLAIGLVFIIGATRERSDATSVDPRSRWLGMRVLAILVLAAFFALAAGLLSVPIALPAYLLGVAAGIDWPGVLALPGVRVSALVMTLMAALRYQDLFEARTSPGRYGQPGHDAPVVGDLDGDRRRALADYAAHVTLIATYVLMCVALIEGRGVGFAAFPLLYTAALVFYDARPDLARRLFPNLWNRR